MHLSVLITVIIIIIIVAALNDFQASLGETKKDRGSESVPIYVKFNDQKLVLGTLSTDKVPQISYDLVFEKEFELSNSSKNASVYFLGYKTVLGDDEEYPFNFMKF